MIQLFYPPWIEVTFKLLLHLCFIRASLFSQMRLAQQWRKLYRVSDQVDHESQVCTACDVCTNFKVQVMNTVCWEATDQTGTWTRCCGTSKYCVCELSMKWNYILPYIHESPCMFKFGMVGSHTENPTIPQNHQNWELGACTKMCSCSGQYSRGYSKLIVLQGVAWIHPTFCVLPHISNNFLMNVHG